MAIFFYYSGEAATIAQDQLGCFVVDDAHSRRWYCVRSPLATLAGLSPHDLHQPTLDTVADMQTRLVRNGFVPSPTTFGVLTLDHEEDLRSRLSEVGRRSVR